MTDETPTTPPTDRDPHTADHTPAGMRFNGMPGAVEPIAEPALRRASAITTPLATSQLLDDDFDLESLHLSVTPQNDAPTPQESRDHASAPETSAADVAEASPTIADAARVTAAPLAETPVTEAPLVETPAAEPAVAEEAISAEVPAAEAPAPAEASIAPPVETPVAAPVEPAIAEEAAATTFVRASVATAVAEAPRAAAESTAQEALPAPVPVIAPIIAPVITPVAQPQPAASMSTERDRARDAEFARYYAVRTHTGPIAFSPEGTQVAYITNTSGQFNVWRQSINGGWPSQVTAFDDESARSLIWTPTGEIIGSVDQPGGEQNDLFSVPAYGGVVRFLTPRQGAQFELSEEGLSQDGRYLVYSGNDNTPTDGDVLIRDMQTGEVRRVLANGHYNVAINWSPDGRYVTVMDIHSNTDMRLWLLEPATGDARELLAHDGECYLAPGPWLPDSSGLYLITDRGTDFKGIARYMLATDTVEWVLTPEWDVEQVALSADGRRLLWTLNESGRSQLHLRDNDQASLRVSGLPIGVIEYMKLSPDGTTLALRINSATAPAEVYVMSLGAIGTLSTPHLRRLTFGMLGGLDPASLIAPELVRYRAADGREIPAWLYRPHGASQAQPAPVVVSIHGGPEAQERVEYRALYQFLLARGIGVLAPNIRGSTGYGKAYQSLIHRDWGGAELKDIQSAADYLRTLAWVNPQKLGVYGGSFGGFATLSAATRLPDYWAAAVDIVGPSNLETFVRSVPPTWRRWMAAWVGDPDEDAAMLRERSPITYIEQIRAPLLVLQGANDPRVTQAETDQMVQRLRNGGHEVEYVIFPDEGHGFTRRANLMRAYALTADFFERRLR